MTESARDLARKLLADSVSGAPGGTVNPAAVPRGQSAPGTSAATVARPRREPGRQFADHPEVAAAVAKLAMIEEAYRQSPLINPLFLPRTGSNGAVIDIAEPRLGNAGLVNFGAYNYLGLANDPRIVEGAKRALDRYGTSASAGRIVGGEIPLYRELERRLADIYTVDDAMVTPNGFMTNAGVIGFLLGPGDVAICDALIHGSAIAGVQWSGARRLSFRHNDPESLRMVLRTSRNGFDRALVVIEGHYSMDGTVGRVAELASIAREFDCAVMVDEAHSFGVFGERGHGIREHYGMPADAVDIWMGTLSKALCSCGGFIAADADLVGALKFSAPGFVMTCAPAPSTIGSALAALEVLEAEPERLARLWANARQFHMQLIERGVNIGDSEGTPICPVIVPGEIRAGFAASTLMERGIYAANISAPVVPAGQDRLRFFITAEHTPAQLEYTADTLAEVIELAERIPDPTTGD